MYHKIAKPIGSNTKTDKKQIIHSSLHAKIKKYNTGNGKNYKKYIVALECMSVFGLVMVGVKIPHEPMHDVFMSKPSDAFHE
jgi:hypothetical protein